VSGRSFRQRLTATTLRETIASVVSYNNGDDVRLRPPWSLDMSQNNVPGDTDLRETVRTESGVCNTTIPYISLLVVVVEFIIDRCASFCEREEWLSQQICENLRSSTIASQWRLSATTPCVLQTLLFPIYRCHSGHYHIFIKIIIITTRKHRQSYRHADSRPQRPQVAQRRIAMRNTGHMVTSNRATVTVFVTVWPCPLTF